MKNFSVNSVPNQKSLELALLNWLKTNDFQTQNVNNICFGPGFYAISCKQKNNKIYIGAASLPQMFFID